MWKLLLKHQPEAPQCSFLKTENDPKIKINELITEYTLCFTVLCNMKKSNISIDPYTQKSFKKTHTNMLIKFYTLQVLMFYNLM